MRQGVSGGRDLPHANGRVWGGARARLPRIISNLFIWDLIEQVLEYNYYKF
jgi:hypothetical protein